jgi:hypothetical protein
MPTAASYPVFASGTHPACGAQSRRTGISDAWIIGSFLPRPSGALLLRQGTDSPGYLLNRARIGSTGSTGAPASPSTVHDTAPLTGITTLRTITATASRRHEGTYVRPYPGSPYRPRRARDNASATQLPTLIDYIKDTPNLGRDKCRWGAGPGKNITLSPGDLGAANQP